MRLERLELVHLKLPLVHFFETSFGRVTEHETIIVRAESSGAVGYGEAPASAAPSYSYETVRTVWHIIRDFLARKLQGVEILKPGPIAEIFSSVRGHNMAKAAVEMAVLDLLAKLDRKPLHVILGGTRDEIPTGISLGIEDRIGDLLHGIEKALAKGYQRIKVKIKPRWDIDVLTEIRRRFSNIPLMADANSAYGLSDLDHLKKFDEFNLMMLEQPLDYDDYVDHAKLQRELRTPLCLDESIRSYNDGRRAIELGSCKIINIKQARVGGPYNAKMLHNLCAKSNVPVWCGGLLESGIGRAHNIALATLPNFTLPGDISASDRYYHEDVIDPPVRVTPQGTIKVSNEPGIGHAVLEDRLQKYCVRREVVLP
ncbi:MAG: o-succinylbenzoate synthase [Planctomycetes bacterium]|nr:o-succinylbenzoate synthase [Planctomycetota bacterium]